MILLCCGGRDYADREKVYATLDAIHTATPIALVIEGGADGADGMAKAWACSRGVQVETHHANWILHGKAAGPIRNAEMLSRNPDLVVAFPGGRGTAHMVRIAKAKGTEVREIE